MIAHGLAIYVALEAVDMRLGFERLGGVVRERMAVEPRTRALFAFIGKRVHKKLDCGKFELPRPTRMGEQHIIVSDAIFDVIFKGVSTIAKPRTPTRDSPRVWLAAGPGESGSSAQ